MTKQPGQQWDGEGTTEKEIFLQAERQQESSGNYTIVNPNSGALGAWQVMPSNLSGWLTDSGQAQMSDYDYLHDVNAQNQLAWVILGGYYDKYGVRGAAAMWYSGQPDPTKTYGDPPVYQYVDDVVALMKKKGFTVNYGTAPGGPDFNLPPPHEGDWSGQVYAAAKAHQDSAGQLANYAHAFSTLR